MDAEITSRFQSAGLEVIGGCSGGRGPSVAEAFRRVVHIDAEPVDRIQRNESGAARRVDEFWKDRARNGRVVADDGSFLAAAGIDYGWVHVRLTENTDISAMEDPEGGLLFIARSMSGHNVCAASTEEGEYWILELEFPEFS
ncbi:hypothetical protein [Streptomyces sp. 142MFCol3.1]|uniref:hypothetical protein n=1 Tax=Streptomyces sp. 142MFCol3.1 TaxID=1172179 RepID=UPI0018F8AE5B|nr:hypothetical protein [Streptomyces sp. 142MFCol3.1]